ncbi:MAG: hypothetical protein GWP10_03755 [Nitrospiraceae bacterium]|nr:hypothetical protein [Nitrospiraceae bacterium]
MKLQQNAKELVLVNVDGLGLILGEIRYNRQTETAIFALEKAAFFDLYFPCAIVYDQERGPIIHPHLLTVLTTSSIRIQRSHVSCFILETDINPVLIQQYYGLLDALSAKQGTASPQKRTDHQGPERPKPVGGSRVINLRDHKEKN